LAGNAGPQRDDRIAAQMSQRPSEQSGPYLPAVAGILALGRGLGVVHPVERDDLRLDASQRLKNMCFSGRFKTVSPSEGTEPRRKWPLENGFSCRAIIRGAEICVITP
jgi:hypothetical protein